MFAGRLAAPRSVLSMAGGLHCLSLSFSWVVGTVGRAETVRKGEIAIDALKIALFILF